MNTDKYNPQAIRDAFKFLVDEFGYIVTLDKETNYSFILDFVGNDRQVHLNHDYKDDTFYFRIYRGANTKYSDHDRENIRAFWEIFKYFEPDLDSKELDPVNQTCKEAALINAGLLKKYAVPILRGEQWL